MSTHPCFRPAIKMAMAYWAAAQCYACPADLNGDGILDNADLHGYVQRFMLADSRADVNGDDILDGADIAAFVESYLEGCPVPTPVRQNYAGVLRLTGGTTGYIGTSAGPVVTDNAAADTLESSGSDFVAGDTAGWCMMRVRFYDGVNAPGNQRFGGCDSNFSGTGVNGIFNWRMAVGDLPYFYIVEEGNGASFKGVQLCPALTADGAAAYEDYWLFCAWEVSATTLDGIRASFDNDWVSGRHMASYYWQPGDASVSHQASAVLSLAWSGIGHNRGTSQSFDYFFGSTSTSADVAVAEVAFGNSLTGLTKAAIQAVAKGEATPQSISSCIRWFQLDRYATGAPGATDVELLEKAGSDNLMLDDIGGAAVWQQDNIGDTVTSAIDPLEDLDYSDTEVFYGNKAALGAIIATKNYDIWEIGDSFSVDGSPRSPIVMMIGRGSADDFPLVGYHSGWTNWGPVSVNTPVFAGTGVGIDLKVQDGNWSGGENTYLGSDNNGFPWGAALEIDGGSGNDASQSTAPIFTVDKDRFWSNNATLHPGTSMDWLQQGDNFSFRVATYHQTSLTHTMQVGDGTLNDASADLSGAYAMPRWSDGSNPFTDAARTPGASEKIVWLASNHPAYEAGAGDPALTVTFGATPAVTNNAYGHVLGFSIHKTDANGNPLSGITYSSLGISSSSTALLSTSHNAADQKTFADTELLAWANGVTWDKNKPILCVVHSADYDTEDNWNTALDGATPLLVGEDGTTARTVGLLARMRWVAAQLGRPIHFLLVNPVIHTLSSLPAALGDEESLMDIKAGALAMENAFREEADEHADVTVWSMMRWYGGMYPGGVTSQAGASPPTSTARIDFDTGAHSWKGIPQRDARCVLEYWLPTERGITLSDAANTTRILDNSGLHAPSLNGNDNEEFVTWSESVYAIWEQGLFPNDASGRGRPPVARARMR